MSARAINVFSPFHPASRRTTVVAAALSCLIFGAPAAWAQGAVFAYGGADWSAGTIPSGSYRCGDVGTQPIPGPESVAQCTGGPSFAGLPGIPGLPGKFDSRFLTGATARAVGGSLGAMSSANWFIQKSDLLPSVIYPITSGGAGSEARWSDRALLTALGGGPSARFLDLTFRLTGSISGTEGLNYPIPGFGTGWIGRATGQVAFAGSTLGSSFFGSQVVRLGQLPSPGLPLPELYTLRIGISGLASNEFLVALTTQAGFEVFGDFLTTTAFEGFMRSNFLNTATPISYRLIDELGNDATARYGVTFERGLQIPSTVVPEPTVGALLLLGLAVLGAGRRRYHRPA